MAASEHIDGLTRLAGFLREKTNRYAWIGLGVSVAALLIGNALAANAGFGGFRPDELMAAQRTNPALWLLDLMPLLFLAWGQQIGTLISYQAGAMVLDQTRALRDQASALEYQLERSAEPLTLTNLPNQRSFAASLTRAIVRRSEQNGHCAVLAIDTRLYHEIALTQGDDAAREFIGQINQRLRDVIEPQCVVAHFGYDDFAILVRNLADPLDLESLAHRIQLALDTPLMIRRQPVSLRTSIGIAIYPEHGQDAASLIRHAETAKYAASAGQHNYLLYDSTLERAHSEAPRLMAELHAALDHEGLGIEVLEQHPLQAGHLPRLRMLTCWLHPRRGRLGQESFIDLPSRSSVVHALTLWQLQQACDLLVGARQSFGDARLGLRLAASAYSDSHLAQSISSLLRAHDLPADALILELHESLLLEVQGIGPQLQRLHNAGIGLCLCDVGLPGASPANLLNHPIRMVRLAPALLSKAAAQDDARCLLITTIDQLRQLGAGVVISGVDTPALLELARATSADYAEGPACRASQAVLADDGPAALAAAPA